MGLSVFFESMQDIFFGYQYVLINRFLFTHRQLNRVEPWVFHAFHPRQSFAGENRYAATPDCAGK